MASSVRGHKIVEWRDGGNADIPAALCAHAAKANVTERYYGYAQRERHDEVQARRTAVRLGVQSRTFAYVTGVSFTAVLQVMRIGVRQRAAKIEAGGVLFRGQTRKGSVLASSVVTAARATAYARRAKRSACAAAVAYCVVSLKRRKIEQAACPPTTPVPSS